VAACAIEQREYLCSEGEIKTADRERKRERQIEGDRDLFG
jgi:predicted nucleic acid-binding Zn ribbon protein